MTWKAVGAVLPAELSQARLQLHWAAQLVSAAGTSLLPAEADYAHTNLGWESTLALLEGRHVGNRSLQAALVFEGPDLVVIAGGLQRASMRLAGHTLQQALAWLGQELAGDSAALTLPGHDMPAHPVGDGGVFSDAGPAARAELAAWFANAFASIREVVGDEFDASPVRCWPHHFDVASLITLDAGAGAEEAGSVGVGFSPGDGSYDQPYFYVTPWPYPENQALPTLEAAAQWHTDGWTGMVLTGERLISVPPDDRQLTVQRALRRGVAACREVLGA